MTLAAFLAVAIDSGLEGALLLVLFKLSHGMEEAVSKKAKSALHHLNDIAPKFAHFVDAQGIIYEKAVRDIKAGACLLIKQGEVVPLDGVILEGTSSINLVHLTGETVPNLRTPGDTVPAGARNLDAALTIQVTRTSADSTLNQIIELITAAQSAKPRVQRLLDRFGKHYATSIIALTGLFALTLPWIFAIPYIGLEGSVYRALAFLIAASPCALIIATPTAYLSAISSCARKGILLKGGITLDALATCRIIAFDKTGTLTTGDLECTGVEAYDGAIPTDEPLAVAAALERQVVHPIATAICKLAADKKLNAVSILDFKAIPGYGVEGKLTDGRMVALGLPEYVDPRLKSLQAEDHILAALKIGDQLFIFRFVDQIRREVPQLLQHIQTHNLLQPIMLTGDRRRNALFVGRQLGLQAIFADLRPEDKLAKVSQLSQTSGLAMVGDGINDAPALARATVGISMGRIGSATAVDASDVVLLNDDLHLLPWLFSKAVMTQTIVRQNIGIALSVIALATIPALLGMIPLWLAVTLHEGGTLLVGINSLRLLRTTAKP